MARSAVVLCIAALAAVTLRSVAFLPAPQAPLRGEAALVAAAGAAAVMPEAANAFVYNGKEYFDVTFGISPLAWGFAAFAILFYGATVKNAAQKYNKPWGTNTISAPKPPKMGGKFVGLEVENKVDSYKAV